MPEQTNAYYRINFYDIDRLPASEHREQVLIITTGIYYVILGVQNFEHKLDARVVYRPVELFVNEKMIIRIMPFRKNSFTMLEKTMLLT